MALALAVTCANFTAFAAETKADEGGVTFDDFGATENDIIVLYTNDIHGGTSDNEPLTGTSASLGFAGLAAVKAEAEEATGGNVTLIDNGDCIQGSVVTSESDGADTVTIMEAVGYDLNVPGNHEFDYGIDYFLDLASETSLNYMCANLYTLDYSGQEISLGELVLPNEKADTEEDGRGTGYDIETYHVRGRDIKVAYITLDTPESISKGTPSEFQNEDGTWAYTFDGADNTPEEFYQIIQDNIDAVRDTADLVVVTGHIGDTGVTKGWSSPEIIENTTGIDVFLDGHAHSTIEGREIKDKDGNTVILTSTGTKLEKIGCMKISVAEDGSVTVSTGLIDTITDEEKAGEAYEEIEKLVTGIEDQYEYLMEEVGYTENGLYIYDPDSGERMVRSRETNMADFIADAYLWYAASDEGAENGFVPADAAFTYGGGVRADINPGIIKYADVYSVLPWHSPIAEIKTSGQQILDFLEMGARLEPEECGGFIQVSGLTYVINMNQESNVVTDSREMFQYVDGDYRVQDVMIGGEPLDTEKEYIIMINTYYYLEGGDGMTMFFNDEAIAGEDESFLDIDLVNAYLMDGLNGEVPDDYEDPYGDGRIAIIPEETAEAAA